MSVAILGGMQIEGNLIAPDLTTEMLAGTTKGQLPKGQSPEDFNFAKTDKLTDEIAIAWGDAKAYWAASQRAVVRLSDNDLATTVTREQWVVPLLRSLGYDPVYTAKAEVVDGQTYALSHRTDPGEDKPPIHVVGCRVKLEQRPPSGKPRLSAHALMQEYLNRTEHLWGIVTNGLQWRLLRDSSLMTRLTYIEFDLEQILNGDNFAEFGLFYRLFHCSRLPQGIDDTDVCLLEYYHQQAIQQGGRVRDRLRDGVEKALVLLGTGFLQHPANGQLRQSFESGGLADTVFYRQLLMLIYRLLFLMVAEARKLLLTEADPEKERIYLEYYSVTRLRNLAERPSYRREGFQDLWQGLRVTFRLFDENWRGEVLGLSPLNGDLFGSKTLKHLDEYAIDNHELLSAIRQLSLYEQNGQSRLVNYAALDVEELGSVYESLLDFHPQVVQRQGIYEFQLVTGSDRKTTSSYYTSPELVGELIKSALEPVIEEKLKEAKTQLEREAALLSLKVCDPACGSGHFLLAAARRLGAELARVRTGEAQPGPEPLRKAIRDVVQNCIYGVDLNPLAVDLCKVALWIEGFNCGMPLNFLDHRIKCGNSLVGVLDLECLKEGIPDEAYKAVTGDDKSLSSQIRKRNKQERETDLQGQLSIFERFDEERSHYAQTAIEVGAISEVTTGDVCHKQVQYQQSRQDSKWWRDYSACNLWTAAFFMPLTEQNLQLLPTTAALTQLLRGNSPAQELLEAVNKLAQERHFFHWCLEFPEVFEAGKFDCVLGNPPWERLQFEERTFFVNKYPLIYNESNQAKRHTMIDKLKLSKPDLYQAWVDERRHIENEANLLRSSGRFPLSAVDKFNLYAVFSELALNLYSSQGCSGIIVKAGLISDKLCSNLFSYILKSNSLVSVAEFENKLKLFPAVHGQERFALITLGREVNKTDFSFDNLKLAQLREIERHIKMSYNDIILLSPNTKNCPKFSCVREFEITKKCYAIFLPLIQYEPLSNEWNLAIERYINVSDFSNEIILSGDIHVDCPTSFKVDHEVTPIYEGKLIHQYDHRYASYLDKGNDAEILGVIQKFPESAIKFQRFISKKTALRRNPQLGQISGLLAVRDITNRTNERGVIAAIIPSNITDYTIRIVRTSIEPSKQLVLLSVLNSFVFDYLARQRIGGTHLSNYILEQTPIIPPNYCTSDIFNFIVPSALELTYTAWDLEDFAKDCGYYGLPFPWDEERRFLLRCELDAACFHLYRITSEDMEYIMETFPIIKRKDEQRYGEYRTKYVISKIYNAMAKARTIGKPYETILNPPPANQAITDS